jgi:hypothetical protein
MRVKIECAWYDDAILVMRRSGAFAAIAKRMALHVLDQQLEGWRRGAGVDESGRCLGHRIGRDVAEDDVGDVHRLHAFRDDGDAVAAADIPEHRNEIIVPLDHARYETADAGDGLGIAEKPYVTFGGMLTNASAASIAGLIALCRASGCSLGSASTRGWR